MRIGFVPIDNRPVCYTLPKMIADIDDDAELFLPERSLLGSLEKYAEVDSIFEWLKSLSKLDAIVLSLDTIAYGGLISSRRCPQTFEEIKARIYKLKDILSSKGAKIYAFSSIMRISNNNVNEEEKEYWSDWGKKIFEYSYNLDKFGAAKTDVPQDILKDYMNTRKRNFEINKIYLEWQKEGFFDTLVFSKDDCAEFGLNVREAKELEKLGGFVKTGADEIPLTLLARAIKGCVKVCPIFIEPDCKNLISNYEDVSIEKSVLGQLELAEIDVAAREDANILLYINNFRDHQGEIVMGVDTTPFEGAWTKPEKPYMIADVRFANGADNAIVKQLFEQGLGEKFCGYSGWNTSANTLGSLICAAKMKFLSKKYNESAFKKLQAVRFLDDWAYQANVRQKKPSKENLCILMKDYEKIVLKGLDIDLKPTYNYPWNRFFEVEVELN